MIRFFILLPLFLAACGNVGGLNLGNYADPGATPQNFIVCHGYGCSHKTRTGFTEAEWQAVRDIFKKESKTAHDERLKIATAIAEMENFMGVVVGTKDDLPKAPILRESNTEQDCIDETVNTTKYLRFLEKENLLKFHTVGRPVYRGFMLDGTYPHNSATVVESETEQVFVIDSYIYKNGEKPDIRPAESWRKHRIEELEAAENLNRAAIDNLTP